MRRPPRPLEVLVVGLVVLAGAALYHFGPWLLGDRTIVASTPAGFPLGPPQEIELAPSRSACLSQVGLTPDSQVAVFLPRTHGAPPVPIEVRLSAPGYRAGAVARDYRDEQPAAVPVAAPRRDLVGTVCLRNAGRRTVWLTGTTEAHGASVQSATTVDGRAVESDLSLRFEERRPESVLDHAGEGLARLALWKPGILGVPVLWALAFLVALGVPVAAVWAYAASVRDPAGDGDGRPG